MLLWPLRNAESESDHEGTQADEMKPEVHSKVSGLSSAGNVKVMENKERLNSTKGNWRHRR